MLLGLFGGNGLGERLVGALAGCRTRAFRRVFHIALWQGLVFGVARLFGVRGLIVAGLQRAGVFGPLFYALRGFFARRRVGFRAFLPRFFLGRFGRFGVFGFAFGILCGLARFLRLLRGLFLRLRFARGLFGRQAGSHARAGA